MKKYYLILLVWLLVSACAPVLSKSLLSQGDLSTGLLEIKRDPDSYKGRLFILGGIIVNTSTTKDGSLIEAISVPVNSLGYLRNLNAAGGRFLAVYKSREILDPLIYREKREITLAGEFVEIRKGQIGEMEYDYPLFEIKEIYLWEEYKEKDYYYYYAPPHYPPWYYRHRPYDPWWWYY